VYVLPEFVDGRDTAAHGRTAPAVEPADTRVMAALAEWLTQR